MLSPVSARLATPLRESGTSDIDDWTALQSILTGLNMINIQYWAGSRTAQNRAMEVRFNELLKVCVLIILYSFRALF